MSMGEKPFDQRQKGLGSRHIPPPAALGSSR
jgi:hypothetical protein